jgi:hypothetical protein
MQIHHIHRTAITALMVSAFGVNTATAQVAFSDQTASAGLTFSTAPAVDAPGLPMWGGTSIGDFNRDGWPDVFVAGGGRVADKLFINNGNATFTDQAASWGLTDLYRGNGTAVGDYDNDGDLDIFVTSAGDMSGGVNASQHRLYQNNFAQGSSSFTNVAAAAGVNFTSATVFFPFGASFGDYDLDGDLDLFVSTWSPPDGTPNDGNRLFRNNGNGTFTDVTVDAGVFDTTIHGFSPRFVDMNGDRYPELLLTNDFVSSRYFVNNGNGTFTNRTVLSNTAKDRNGMGTTVGDFNNDGLIDWYVTSIYTAAKRPNNGNIMYLNRGGNIFTQLPESVGVSDGGFGWGTVAIDFDHDGWQDLAETNGWMESEYQNEPSYLYRNNGNMTFTEVHAAAGLVNTHAGKGLVHFDYDLDGDMDILITSNNFNGSDPLTAGGPISLYRNDLSGAATNWLQVRLDTTGTGLAPDGFGSRLRIKVDGTYRYFALVGGSNFLGQSELVAHFGVGAASVIDELYVVWSNGSTTLLQGVGANQSLTLVPPATFTPGVSLKNAYLLEGSSGTPNAAFTVALTAASPTDTVVDFATTDGTALAGSDYTLTVGMATIPAGALTATILVPVTADTDVESDEFFTLDLTGVTNGNLADSTATGTIANDDGVLLAEDFEDGIATWSGKGFTTQEIDGSLLITATKTAKLVAPVPWLPSNVSSCFVCTIETVIETAGGAGNQVSVIGWWVDWKHYVELRMDEGGNRWSLAQRAEGVTSSVKVSKAINPFQSYHVKMDFDGTHYHVWVDDELLLTVAPAVTPQAGKLAMLVKSTTATVRSVRIY